MTDHIEGAKKQALLIGDAINGDSSAVEPLGNIGRDPRPELLLAVGLAHAMNAIGQLISEVEDLRSEVAELRAKRGIFR